VAASSSNIILEAAKYGDMDDIVDRTITGEVETTTQFGDWFQVGDVNNDGYDDILLSAEQWKHDGGTNNARGRVYLYYGQENMMDENADKTFTGESAGDELGDNGVYLADMNNDNFDDVILGARYFNSKGRLYIYWGAQDMDENADLTIDPPSVDGSNIQFGRGIAAGDLNNDGDMDLIVSAIQYQSFKGRSYLYYGPIASDATVDKTFTGTDTNDVFGAKLCARGDVDGDNCDDLLVGSMYWPNLTYDGRAYLYYGDPTTTMDETCDVYFDAENTSDQLACGIDLFDVDNDGYADVIITARKWPSSTYRGRAYLYWGADRTNFSNTPDLYFNGETDVSGAFGGESVMAGYVNNDNYGDILFSAFDYKNFSQHGRAYLYYGDAQGSMDTTCDHTFTGETTDCQPQRAGIADLNGDNYGDVIMAGYEYNNYQGRAWVWYSNPEDWTNVDFDWDTTGASFGDHSLEGKADLGEVVDGDPDDNSQSTTTTVYNSTTMRLVGTIDNAMSLEERVQNKKNTYVKVLVTITVGDYDEDVPIPGALVEGSWSGATTDTDSGLTDSLGKVTFESNEVLNPSSGTTYTFTVTDVTKSGWTYDSQYNDDTSGSISVP